MSERQEGLTLIGILICTSFVFQTQSKLFANELAPLLDKANATLLLNLQTAMGAAFGWRPFLIAILGCVDLLLWLLVLTRIELSLALPVASISLLVNTIGGALLLGESLPLARILGVLAIAVGIALVLRT
jgi:drug/metabolite transporter (DMT)-like permease